MIGKGFDGSWNGGLGTLQQKFSIFWMRVGCKNCLLCTVAECTVIVRLMFLYFSLNTCRDCFFFYLILFLQRFPFFRPLSFPNLPVLPSFILLIFHHPIPSIIHSPFSSSPYPYLPTIPPPHLKTIYQPSHRCLPTKCGPENRKSLSLSLPLALKGVL